MYNLLWLLLKNFWFIFELFALSVILIRGCFYANSILFTIFHCLSYADYINSLASVLAVLLLIMLQII